MFFINLSFLYKSIHTTIAITYITNLVEITTVDFLKFSPVNFIFLKLVTVFTITFTK